jgi:hypothetical protein
MTWTRYGYRDIDRVPAILIFILTSQISEIKLNTFEVLMRMSEVLYNITLCRLVMPQFVLRKPEDGSYTLLRKAPNHVPIAITWVSGTNFVLDRYSMG